MGKRWNRGVAVTVGCMLLSTGLLAACSKSGSGAGGTAADNGPITLTIAVINNERFFDSLKQKYEAAHPNVKVEFKEYMATITDKSSAGSLAQIQRDLEKYVSTVTTEMAGGKGPDLLVSGSLPYKKMADKHLLANIRDLMKNDSSFHTDRYFTNVFDSMKYKEGYYALPTSVQFTNLWMGDGAALSGKIDDSRWTWQDFVNQLRPLVPKGGAVFNQMPPDRLLGTMLNPGAGRFVDYEKKKATFDSPEFKQLLTTAKTMIDERLAINDMNSKLYMIDTFGFRYVDDFFAMTQMMFDGQGKVISAPNVMNEPGYAFRSNLTLSINDKSKHKAEAWDFLKFVLSDEIQTDRSGSGMRGMPVSKAAFEQLKNEMKDPSKLGNMKIGDRSVPLQPPTQEQLNQVESYMTGIRYAQETDDKLAQLVTGEAAAFFSGQKSVDDMAKAIQSKVTTYLNE